MLQCRKEVEIGVGAE